MFVNIFAVGTTNFQILPDLIETKYSLNTRRLLTMYSFDKYQNYQIKRNIYIYKNTELEELKQTFVFIT